MTRLLSSSKISKNSVAALIAFVLVFDLALAAQKLGGAYQSEFADRSHEAAHYVSSLYWRDFIVSAWQERGDAKHEGLSAEKEQFTRDWVTHYPHLETGKERSLFTAVEALWMLVFPPVRGSLLILMAGLSAIVATQLFCLLREEYGGVGAGIASAVFLALPLMREFTALAAPDLLAAVLVFGAAMAFGNFLDREKNGDALLAGSLAALAILTSASGNEIWGVLIFAFLMSRKFLLVRRPIFLGAIIPGIAASLFWRGYPAAGKFQWDALPFYAGRFTIALGLVLTALMAVGIVVKIRCVGQHRGRWVAAGALLLGAPFWLAFKPGDPDSRFLLPMLPAVVMFALAGGAWLVEKIAPRAPEGGGRKAGRPALVAALAVVALGSVAIAPAPERSVGFAPLVETLLDDSAPGDITLVSSDPNGEERFIAELAVREKRPGHILFCGTRTLANPGKKQIHDEPAFGDEEAVFAFLTSGKIKYVVVDDSVPYEAHREHHYQLQRAIEAHLNRFWVIANSPVTRDGEAQSALTKLYKIKDAN